MSFCAQVKNELSSIRLSGCCKPSYTYGFMLFGRSFSYKKIALQTTNEAVCRAYCDAVFSTYKIKPEVTVGGSARPTYKASIDSEADRLKILASVDYGVDEKVINNDLFLRECCPAAFVRGAFMACGNINDPEKEYRAEFNIKQEKEADELLALLCELGITFKKVKITGGIRLYTKESAAVEDLLTLMGAGKKTLDIIDTKIIKSVKNNINRARNCDNANISKTVEASIRQRTAIEFLEQADRLYSLPQELLTAALLRKENPDATLKELCKLSEEPLTVSGLNHRLNRIIDIYEEMKR